MSHLGWGIIKILKILLELFTIWTKLFEEGLE